jgi:hypothetical protein
MLDTFFGLPTHALIVHAVVVLLPTAAIGGVAVALVPWLRRRYGEIIALTAIVSVIITPIAVKSGSKLFDRRSAQFGPGDDVEAGLMERHADLAHQLFPWVVVLAVGVLLVVLPPLLAPRLAPARAKVAAGGGPAEEEAPPARAAWELPVAVLGTLVTLVGAVLVTILVVRIGHLGAEAAWQHVKEPA